MTVITATLPTTTTLEHTLGKLQLNSHAIKGIPNGSSFKTSKHKEPILVDPFNYVVSTTTSISSSFDSGLRLQRV